MEPASTPTSVALEDIARKLGIAVSTVSRALRDMPGIHPATRIRVMREAEALGYMPPRKRSEEAPPQPRNILTLTLGGDVPASYLSGLSRSSLQLNFALLSHHFSREESHHVLNPIYQPHSLRLGMVAGIILVYKWPEEVVESLSRKWPTVSIVHTYPGLNVDVIGIDHVSGIFSLVKHMREAGHERIGYFGLNSAISWSRSRFAAYMEAMLALELPFRFDEAVMLSREEVVATAPFKNEAAFDKVTKLIGQGVSGWICANDLIGNTLSGALIQRGIRVPEDVALTGFHREAFRPPHLPQLTTTEVDGEQLGAGALRRLAYRLDHPNESQRTILLPCQFLQGETTLPVGN